MQYALCVRKVRFASFPLISEDVVTGDLGTNLFLMNPLEKLERTDCWTAIPSCFDTNSSLTNNDKFFFVLCLSQLMPRPTDLSYYNWETQTSTSNSTPNFQVEFGRQGLRPISHPLPCTIGR